MKVTVNNLPKIKLENLLKRRKITMKAFLDEMGITTYDSLVNRCDRIGVQPPTQDEFVSVMPETIVNNPLEGVVVVEPPPTIKELTGKVEQDDVVFEGTDNFQMTLGVSQVENFSNESQQTINVQSHANMQRKNFKKNK